MRNFLVGRKTYLTALLMLIVGGAKLAGVEVPGFESASGGQLIIDALAFAFLRNAAPQKIDPPAPTPIERDNTDIVRGDSKYGL